jgi:uncharacterized protein
MVQLFFLILAERKSMRLLASICAFVFTTILNGQTKNDQLFEAVQKNEKDKVEMLLKAGCDANYVKIGSPYLEITPLIVAVQNKNTAIAKLLIDHKANVNWKDNLKASAIIYAVNAKDPAMVKLLSENGANLHDQDSEGRSVSYLAKATGNKDVIQYIEAKLTANKQ